MNKNRETLRNSCDKVSDFTYMKTFDLEEIAEFKNDLSSIMINADVYETKLKEIKDEYKEKLDPLRRQVKELLTFLRDKAKTVSEECYINFEGEFAVYYNGDGEEVYKRPLEQSERQKTIFMEQRNGTE